MSELKEHLFVPYSELQEGDELTDAITIAKSYYLKSEADKVIAELKADYKEACDRLKTANLIKDEQLAATRHHKHKRCLAMAKWCDASMAYFGEFHDSASNRMVDHYYKWRGHWYELAEKFKEAK